MIHTAHDISILPYNLHVERCIFYESILFRKFVLGLLDKQVALTPWVKMEIPFLDKKIEWRMHKLFLARDMKDISG